MLTTLTNRVNENKKLMQLWCPYLAKGIDILEKVLVRATKLVKGFERLPYITRLQKIALY